MIAICYHVSWWYTDADGNEQLKCYEVDSIKAAKALARKEKAKRIHIQIGTKDVAPPSPSPP